MILKKLTISLAVFFFSTQSFAFEKAYAIPEAEGIDAKTCATALADLEEKAGIESPDDDNIYDACGFNNEKLVWARLASTVSAKEMKRAIYEVCERYPNHAYHKTYCEKSAALGYGPALIHMGVHNYEQGNSQKGDELFLNALKAGVTPDQEGRILETMGVYYLKNNDKRAQSYLEKASLKRSALANNVLAYLTFWKKDEIDNAERLTFDYLWRAILLNCKSAEENLGLFHLVRLKKLPYETALSHMKKNIYSCTPNKEKEKKSYNIKEFASCRCKTAIEAEQRFRSKPYLLKSTSGTTAIIEYPDGKTTLVSKNGNLPDGAHIDDIRKTAMILSYPDDRREILNIYKPDKCLEFCATHNITENLSLKEMETIINGIASNKVKIKPYHITFTPNECDTIAYYAPSLVDVSLPYKGKEECQLLKEKERYDPIMDLISETPQQEEY